MSRSLAIGSQQASRCKCFGRCSINHANLRCTSRVGAGTAHPGTTATQPQQHVASAGVQCETELWLEPPITGSWDPEEAMQQPSSMHADTAAAAAVLSTLADAGEHGPTSSKHALHPECLPDVDSNGSSSISSSSSSSSQPTHEAARHPSVAEWSCTETPPTLQQLCLASQQQLQNTAAPPALAAAADAQGCQQQQQQQLQTDDAREFQKSLVRSLRSCSSIDELQELIGQHGVQMDCMSLTSCFSAAARLATQQQQQRQEPQKHLQQAQTSLMLHVQELIEQQVPVLQHVQETAQLQQLLQQGQVQQRAQQDPQVPSPRHQLQALMRQQLLPLLQRKLAQLDTVGLVLVLHSFVVLGFRDEALLTDMEQTAVPLANQLTPRLLSQLVWCLGQLNVQPQQQLMRQVLLHSARQLQRQQCNSQDCAQLLHGLARLLQQLPVQWMALYVSRVEQLLLTEQLQPQSLCIIIHSLGRLSQQQQNHQQPPLPGTLLQQLLEHAQPLLPSLPPAGLNMLSNAFLLLKTDPSPSWQVTFLQATHAAMAACDARNASVLAVPLLRWRLAPASSWLQQYLETCEPLLQQMQPQGLAVLGHALAGLQLLPPEPWRLQYLAAAHTCSLASTPAGCSYLIHTLAAWQALEAKPSSSISSKSSGSGGRSCSSNSNGSSWSVASIGGIGSNDDQAAADQTNSSGDSNRSRLLQLSKALVQQCVQCFMQQGSGFTAEQLGMFCRGLAGLQLQGSLELAEQLEEVALGVLRGGPSQRTTAATLCNLLLALAGSCPAAATPQLLNHIWASLSQLLHTVQPVHAAAIAWAASHNSSCLQLPPRLQQGLVQHAAVVAEDASQQQLAMLLLEAARAGWPLEQQPLQLLLAEMLHKQAAAVNDICSRDCDRRPSRVSSSSSSSKETQQSTQDLSSSSSSGRSLDSSSSSTDTTSSSGSQAARLYGLSNHRLKGSLAATAAAAAWAHAMTPRSRMAALANCHALALQLDCSMLPLLTMHVCCLASAQPSSSSRSSGVGGGQQQQLLLLPAGLAAVLWQEQKHVLPQLPHAQQQVMQQLWRGAGLCE